jgi:CRP/FNR family transcriptional regulator, cyclic AMP receptor protein
MGVCATHNQTAGGEDQSSIDQPTAQAMNIEALERAPWMLHLSSELRRRVVAETVIRTVQRSAYVCRKGDASEHWIGVLTGLVKVSSVSPHGKSVSFIGVPSGGWFGEGTLLKNERRRYDAIGLRPSTIAYMPRSTFMLLLDASVSFNRFLLMQLNERLGQFVAMVEHDRLLNPDARLATELAAMFNSRLYPGIGPTLPISQEELGQLFGLSRQRVNQALKRLASAKLVRVGYGGITVLDLEGLRNLEG